MVADSIEKSREQIWQIVNAVPAGKVATYGQVANLAGMPQQSRLVGRVLSRLPKGSKLPWHRVINSQGKISNPNPTIQKLRLEKEGVVMVNGRVNLRIYRWEP